MFNNQTWQQPQYGWNSNNFNSRINTNVIRVTSLEEAIMKSNMCDSEMVYFNQGKDEFYTIRVDVNGNKSWQTFAYSIPNSSQEAYVTKREYDSLVARVAALEPKEVKNVESNG